MNEELLMKLAKSTKEITKWTKKLYSTDRFLNQLAEPKQAGKLFTDESKLNRDKTDSAFDIMQRQYESNSNIRRIDPPARQDFYSLVMAMATKKRDQMDLERIKK